MWLSRAGVVEQAVTPSGPPPTITAQVINNGTPGVITITTSEACNFSSITGLSILSNISATNPVSILGISGSDTTGSIGLSRQVYGDEVIQLTVAASNGITSQSTGQAVESGTFSVTNNGPTSDGPLITTRVIETSTPNELIVVTDEACLFNTTSGFTLTTTSFSPLTITGITTVNETQAVFTLSRVVSGAETIELVVAASNGIISATTAAPCEAATLSVTNSAYGMTIDTVTIGTSQYGIDLAQGLTPIPAGQEIITVLTPSNNVATVPTDGLAEYYQTAGVAEEHVLHAMSLTYSPVNWVEGQLPEEADFNWKFQLNPGSTVNDNQLLTWPVEGSAAGNFYPPGGKVTGLNLLGTGIGKPNMFPIPPTLGVSNVPITALGQPSDNDIGVQRTFQIYLAAQNLSASSVLFLTIETTIDGQTVTSPPLRINVPVGAVKETLLDLPEYTITQVQTVTSKALPREPESLFPNVPITGPILTCTLNDGNSFVAPSSSFYDETDEEFPPPPPEFGQVCGHTFQVTYDSAPLFAVINDFPEELEMRYIVTSGGYQSEIGWRFEGEDGNNASTEFDGLNRAEYIQDGIVAGPVASFDNNGTLFVIPIDTNDTTWSVRLEIRNTAGIWVPTAERIITNIFDSVVVQ